MIHLFNITMMILFVFIVITNLSVFLQNCGANFQAFEVKNFTLLHGHVLKLPIHNAVQNIFIFNIMHSTFCNYNNTSSYLYTLLFTYRYNVQETRNKFSVTIVVLFIYIHSIIQAIYEKRCSVVHSCVWASDGRHRYSSQF